VLQQSGPISWINKKKKGFTDLFVLNLALQNRLAQVAG